MGMKEDRKQAMRVAHALEEATGFRRLREPDDRNGEPSVRLKTMEATEGHAAVGRNVKGRTRFETGIT